MSTPEIIGYVCIYCQKAYKESVCPECNEYKSMIPITKNILAMFEEPTLDDEFGECDNCQEKYELASRINRCGDCGDCGDCCQHVGL